MSEIHCEACGEPIAVAGGSEGTHYYVNADGSEHVCKPLPVVDTDEMPDDINCDRRGCFRRLVDDEADTSERETSECRECGATFYADLNGL
jgi:hypothetical protein